MSTGAGVLSQYDVHAYASSALVDTYWTLTRKGGNCLIKLLVCVCMSENS